MEPVNSSFQFFPAGIFLIFAIFAILSLVITITAIVDIVKSEFKGPNDKLIWHYAK